MTDDAVALRGGCHCGKLTVSFSATQAAGALHPRTCDCAFCTKHGAAWLSDPNGTLAIDASAVLREYRQGSGSARFLLCGDCGVLAAVVDDAVPLRGAVNARCLEGISLGEETRVSPQQLSPDEKRARWRQLWTPATLSASH
ncbi:MAG: aldehyde-activating protein [Lysobacter sp.]|nr:aldehyde-activating protein [Lysobacter sp.]